MHDLFFGNQYANFLHVLINSQITGVYLADTLAFPSLSICVNKHRPNIRIVHLPPMCLYPSYIRKKFTQRRSNYTVLSILERIKYVSRYISQLQQEPVAYFYTVCRVREAVLRYAAGHPVNYPSFRGNSLSMWPNIRLPLLPDLKSTC